MSAHDFMSFVRHYMFVSLVVGVIETGCKYAPNCRQRCQEVPKRCLAMPAWFSLFFYKKSMAEGALEPPLFVSRHPTAMGGREGWEPRKALHDSTCGSSGAELARSVFPRY